MHFNNKRHISLIGRHSLCKAEPWFRREEMMLGSNPNCVVITFLFFTIFFSLHISITNYVHDILTLKEESGQQSGTRVFSKYPKDFLTQNYVANPRMSRFAHGVS